MPSHTKKERRRAATAASASAKRKAAAIADAEQAIRVQRSLPRTISSTRPGRRLEAETPGSSNAGTRRQMELRRKRQEKKRGA